MVLADIFMLAVIWNKIQQTQRGHLRTKSQQVNRKALSWTKVAFIIFCFLFHHQYLIQNRQKELYSLFCILEFEKSLIVAGKRQHHDLSS